MVSWQFREALREELAHVKADFLADAAKGLKLLFGRAGYAFGIHQAPMSNIATERPHRKFLGRGVAQGHHVRKVFLEKLRDVFTPLPAEIDPDFLHHVDDYRVGVDGFDGGARSHDFIAGKRAKKTFRHLAA